MLISAFGFGGTPSKAVQKAFAEADIYISPALLREYREVPLELFVKGKIDSIQFKALISGIAAFVAKAAIIYPKQKLSICRDPKDNIMLECCLEAEAHSLITGDKDLLELHHLPFNLKIITPRQYSRIF